MSELATGTVPSQEHAPQGTPPPAQHATQPPANPQELPPQTPPANAGPSLEDLQKQFDAERQRASAFEGRYKELQGAYTQTRQQLAALTGQQPQADPLAPYVQQLVSKGYEEKDARAIAELSHSMISPLQQQLATSQAALQNQSMVDDVLRAAYAQDQTTLGDPEVFRAVEQSIRQEALQAASTGQPWNPQYAQQYALNVAWQTAGQLRLQRAANPNQPPPVQPPQSPFQRGFTGIQPNFTPANTQAQTVTRTPEQTQLSAMLAERMKPKS